MAVQGKPSQDFIPIKDIRNGVIILNNGDLRMILMTSSLNFGLKSEDEQAAIILLFQNFLNSIEFPVQIFIQSKRLDIRPYIKMLEDREKLQLIDAMKIQTHEYICFIRDFTSRTNIMSKPFFIVIPYNGSNGSQSLNRDSRLAIFVQHVSAVKRSPNSFTENSTRENSIPRWQHP